MQIKVQSIHFDADRKLIEFIHEKVNKLSHFYDRIVDGEVFLRLEKANDLENKVAEIKLKIPGKVLFAKEQCRTFEEATDLAVSALKKQITKHKTRVYGA